MPIYTRYKLSGEVVESRFIELDELTKYSILGQKARVTTKDDKAHLQSLRRLYHHS